MCVCVVGSTFRSVPLFKRDLESEIMDLDGQNTDDMCTTDLLTCDNASTASLCSLAVNSSTDANNSASEVRTFLYDWLATCTCSVKLNSFYCCLENR